MTQRKLAMVNEQLFLPKSSIMRSIRIELFDGEAISIDRKRGKPNGALYSIGEGKPRGFDSMGETFLVMDL